MPRPYQPDLHHTPLGRYRRISSCMVNQARRTQLCPAEPRLDGKLALVTGGSSGIGTEIVKGLARRGAELVVAARGNPDTARDCARWESETGAEVHFISMDLRSLPSVVAASSAFMAAFPHRELAILCANAGVVPAGGIRLNRREGRSYRSAIRRLSPSELEVKGRWGFICRTKIWTQVADDA